MDDQVPGNDFEAGGDIGGLLESDLIEFMVMYCHVRNLPGAVSEAPGDYPKNRFTLLQIYAIYAEFGINEYCFVETKIPSPKQQQ